MFTRQSECESKLYYYYNTYLNDAKRPVYMHTLELLITNMWLITSASVSASCALLHNNFLTNSHCLYHFLSDSPSVSRLINTPSPLCHQLREDTHRSFGDSHT